MFFTDSMKTYNHALADFKMRFNVKVLVSSEEEVNMVDQREPGSGSDPIKDPTKDPIKDHLKDPIKDQHGSIVGAIELNTPHVDAREA